MERSEHKSMVELILSEAKALALNPNLPLTSLMSSINSHKLKEEKERR